jgi:hypothetical protein
MEGPSETTRCHIPEGCKLHFLKYYHYMYLMSIAILNAFCSVRDYTAVGNKFNWFMKYSYFYFEVKELNLYHMGIQDLNLPHVHVDGMRLCLWTAATSSPIVHPSHDVWVWRETVEWLTWENQRTQRKTCSSATLSTTNPIWTDPSTNLGLCSKRPATTSLSHGRANPPPYIGTATHT